MRNKDCKVVQDLLPNYIEKLTSEETNKFIEEHLQECPECKAMLESMKAEIKINTAKQDDREVEYIKKFNVKFKKVEYKLFVLIYTIIAILIVGTLGFFGRKYIIFQDIAKKVGTYINSDNVYIKKYDYLGDDIYIYEYWIQDDNIRELRTFLNYDIENCYTYGFSIKDGKLYENGENSSKIDVGSGRGNIEGALSEFILIQDLLSNPLSIISLSLNTTVLNGKQCYQVRFNNVERTYYIEKETGLIIRVECVSYNYPEEKQSKCCVSDYTYEFNIVTNEDLDKSRDEKEKTESITKTAKLGENANIIDGNLNIEISNLAYDEAKDEFITDIKFSTIDNKGLSSYIVYDYIIYDANCKIVASSIPIGMTPEKRAIAERFAIKNYNSTNYADFMSNMIGVAEQRTNMSEDGIVHQTLTVPNLDQKLNLENLNVLITNIKYKNKGEPETIEPEKDYIFTFN